MFPINYIELCRKIGFNIIQTHLPRHIASILAIIDKRYYIILNVDDSDHRKRFLCMYELGSYVFHDDKKSIDITYRNHILSGSDLDRFRINFSLNILVPINVFYNLYKKGTSFERMILYFGIPPEILNIRIIECDSK